MAQDNTVTTVQNKTPNDKTWDEALDDIQKLQNKTQHSVVCLVGAGFGWALLGQKHEEAYKSSEIIKRSVDKRTVDSDHSPACPILKRLVEQAGRQFSFDLRLNSVWTHWEDYGRAIAQHYEEVLRDYADLPPPMNEFIRFLYQRHRERELIELAWQRRYPVQVMARLLKCELKRMIAHWYDARTIDTTVQNAVKNGGGSFSGLVKFLSREGAGDPAQTTWISLNYDTVLEKVLHEEGGTWQYWFADLVANGPSSGQARCRDATPRHIIVKPHGSLNLWFRTDWPKELRTLWPPNEREAMAEHALGFAATWSGNGRDDFSADAILPDALLKTCEEQKIGCYRDGDVRPVREFRPWLVGYLPDEMQEELNSPGVFADAAHDLCKANLGYAALALATAKAVFILGYSMPPEDKFMWNRIAAIPKERREKIRVYVASMDDTPAIIRGLNGLGITNAYRLNEASI